MTTMNEFEKSLPLGKATLYKSEYDPGLLCPVPRRLKRDELALTGALPFSGVDIWNAYELSWLSPKGKPVVAMGEFRVPCESANLIESKSFKLYLNSLNQTRYQSPGQVEQVLAADLHAAAGAPVGVRLLDSARFAEERIVTLPGRCIDDLDIEVEGYQLDPQLLAGSADPSDPVEETLHSHLLKSNCLVTSQPDWGSVLIRYRGGRIDPEALLRYLISFRQHNEFHEQCVERIFVDLMRFCRPERLTVYARYTRRGGLDINPFRSNFEAKVENLRLARQ
ncbi:NADPH-dependent 7-cyano-7-deazaguanine reductase QueF [Desulfuromonas versatilis]|nr:NADPH-dependent 7-cyano-7-deazaguanine reductase QueF [Desulfuromonas versatilis]